MSALKTAKQRARKLAEEFDNRDGNFSLDVFRERLLEKTADLQDAIRAEAYQACTDKIVEDVDREGRRRAGDTEPSLFNLEGWIPLGGKERRSKRKARLEHLDLWESIKDQNLSAVLAARARDKRELAAVRPYTNDGRTLEDGVAAWRADHPKGPESLAS